MRESEEGEALPEGRVRVKLDYNSEVVEVDEDDVEKANPPSFDRVEDLAQLRWEDSRLISQSGTDPVIHCLDI